MVWYWPLGITPSFTTSRYQLLFPRLPQLSYCPPCKYLIPTRGRAEATGVAMSRPSSHDDGYHTPPCVRGTGHVILAPYPLAV